MAILMSEDRGKWTEERGKGKCHSCPVCHSCESRNLRGKLQQESRKQKSEVGSQRSEEKKCQM